MGFGLAVWYFVEKNYGGFRGLFKSREGTIMVDVGRLSGRELSFKSFGCFCIGDWLVVLGRYRVLFTVFFPGQILFHRVINFFAVPHPIPFYNLFYAYLARFMISNHNL